MYSYLFLHTNDILAFHWCALKMSFENKMKHNGAKIFLMIWRAIYRTSYLFSLFILTLGSEIVAYIKSSISQTKRIRMSVQSLELLYTLEVIPLGEDIDTGPFDNMNYSVIFHYT